jgi:mannonate dehydratase
MLHPGNEPGPGVAPDYDRAVRLPCARACLPVNRLEDGGMFDW